MEDPWSSPWATDTPAPPTIDLPSEPQRAHFGASPRKASRSPSPWGRPVADGEDDWGGWNEAGGKDSPGWGRSPNLKPLGNAAGSLDPWALPGSDEKERDKGADSAISLGDDGRVDGHFRVTSQSWENGQAEVAQEERSDEDEESATAEQAPVEAKQPSKVQELVEMYDGMARIAKVDSAGSNADNTAEVTAEAEAEATADTAADTAGDTAEDTTEDTTAFAAADTTADTAGKSPDGIKDDDEAVQADAADELTNSTPSDKDNQHSEYPTPNLADDNHETNEEAKSNRTTPTHPPVPYAIDFTHLDTLFPNTPAVRTTPEELPESIVKESFTSVSQRKAWYRISRFGSIRKHNDGDDENYVRVGWNDSAVRKDTLTTVRRWMEEDSIGGRVVLGRRLGHGGGSIFNWDSEAPPVEIGELLAKRKPVVHARQVSSSLSLTMPSFGWSSTQSSPSAERFSSDGPAKASRLSEAKEADVAPAAKSPTHVDAPLQNEDDDWGEMVTTPMDSTFGGSPAAPSVAKPITSDAIVPTQVADPWGGLDMFGGGPGTPLQPVPSAKDPPLALSTSAPPTKPITLQSSPASSRPSNELASQSVQEDAAAAILAGLPDLSYMLK